MQPYWALLVVEAGDSRSVIRSGTYHIGLTGGVVGAIVGRKCSGSLPCRRMTRESVLWHADTLVITSEAWMEREDGNRQSHEQHREVWSLDEQGQLVIAATDGNPESGTRTVSYEKERSGR